MSAKPTTRLMRITVARRTTAIEIGLIESGNGFQQGPLAIAAALIAALSLAGIRAWWRASTRNKHDQR